MEAPPNFADTTRKITEAYIEGFSVLTKMLTSFPKDSTEVRQHGEQWLGLARMMKDGTVTAIDQGFELWERELRRLLDLTTATGPSAPSANPMEAWAENWKKSLEAMIGAATTWSEAARKQMELLRKTVQEGLLAWRRLWQPPERKS